MILSKDIDNVKGVLLIAVLVLLASTFLLFVRGSASASLAQDGLLLSASVHDLLDVQGFRCSASSSNPQKTAEECVIPLLIRKDFREDAFKQPRNQESGAIVIKNVGAHTYDSDKFVFQYNRVNIQQGCDVPGDVSKDVTCRFTFSQACEKGDILEIFYPVDDKEIKVFLKTC